MADRVFSYQTPYEVPPEEDRGFFDSALDQYITGPTFSIAGRALLALTPAEPDYVWSKNIPAGYEKYADRYAFTQSRAEASYLTNMIREQNEAEARISRDPIKTQLLGGVAASMFDPTTYIPVPGVYGVGLLKGAARGLATQGAIAAAYDVLGQTASPTSTAERTAALIAGDLFFGTVFGAVGGGVAPRIIGPVAEKFGFSGLGMKAPVEPIRPGEQYLKAHSDNELFLTERINYEDTPLKWQEHAGDRLVINDALPERTEVVPAGLRDIDPEINKPIYHGTGTEDLTTFVREDGSLQLFPSYNDRFNTVGVSFAREFDSSARYARAIPGGSDPLKGMVFEIDESALPNLREEAMGEMFSPTPAALRETALEAINDPRLLPDAAIIIPAGKWRVLAPGQDSKFVPPSNYKKFFPEETVTRPAQEALVQINIPQILGEFESLPAGMFRDRTEWLNYNVNYALNTKYLPKVAGETASAFARRVEAKSMDDVRAGRVPFNPGTTYYEKLAMIGTHHLPAVKAFGDDNFGMTTYEKIISDFAMMNAANYHNRPSVDSVKMRVARKQGESKLLYSRKLEASYASYIANETVPENRFGNIVSNFKANSWFIGNKIRDGKVDKPTFRSMVSAVAENPNSTHFNGMMIPDEAREMAVVFRGILDDYEKIINDYGMSNQAVAIDKRLAGLQRQQRSLSDAIRYSPRRAEAELTAALQKVEAEIADVELEKATLKELKMVPRGVMSYVPHVWRLDVITERREEFTKKLAELFAKDQFEGAQERAEKWVAKLIDGVVDEEDALPTGNGILYLNHRQINASFEDFGDFLETDSDLLLTHYLQKMVPAIEMHRMFGDRAMRTHLDEMRTHLLIKYADLPEKERLKKIGDSLQVLEDARDMVLGTFGVTDASHYSIRGVRLAKGLSVMAHMGMSVLSALGDPIKTAMVNGFVPTFKVLMAHADSSASGLTVARGQAKIAGQALEFVMQNGGNRFTYGDSIVRANGTMIERGVERGVGYFFNANLLTPWTVINKEFAGIVSSHVLLTDIVKVAKAAAKGKTVDAKTLRVLASYGISERDAIIIARQPIEQTGAKINRLYLANTTKWTGSEGQYAREKFNSALYGRIQGSVITPGQGDVGRLFSGVIYKSKARYAVEKQISDLGKERDKILETIRDIRSNRQIPDAIMPSLLGPRPDANELAVRQSRAREITDGFYNKNAVQAAEWLTANTKPEYVPIATKVTERLKALERAGLKTSLTVLEKGSPDLLGKATAHAEVKFGRSLGGISSTSPEVNVVFRGLTDDTTTKKMPPLSDEIALHELIHAAIHGSLKLAREGATFDTAPKLSEARMQLFVLRDSVIKRHKKRVAKAKDGKLTLLPVEEKFAKWNTLDNEDEFVAWGMTSREFQEYLEGIPSPSGLKTMFDDFVNLVRDLLGFAPGQETSLSKLIQITGDLLDVNVNELRALGNARRTRMVEEFPTAAEKAFQPDIAAPIPNQQVRAGNMPDLGDITQKITEGEKPRPSNLSNLLKSLEAESGQPKPPDQPMADVTPSEDAARPLTKDEMIAPYLEQLREISAKQAELKNSAARVGRGGSPLLSLPLQFMSFAVASGPKLAHSILTDRDKSRAMGIMALVTTAYLVNKFKTNEQTWEEMPFEQRVYQAIDRSGITGWLSIAGGTLETHDLGMGALMNWKDPYPATLGRKVSSVLGPTAGDATSVVQALFDPAVSGSEAARMIRRVIPGNNLLYLKYLFDNVGKAIGEYVDDPTVVRPRNLRSPNLPSSNILDDSDFYDLLNKRPAAKPMPIEPDEPVTGGSASVPNPNFTFSR